MAVKKKRTSTGRKRRISDEQILLLKSWVPFKTLARALGIDEKYATRLRKGRIVHKTKLQ
jgi:hypothetical protein